jgi:hypothetical protein
MFDTPPEPGVIQALASVFLECCDLSPLSNRRGGFLELEPKRLLHSKINFG